MKAVIKVGGKQYLVTEGETVEVELLHADGKSVSFQPLLVIDGDKVTVGQPLVDKVAVKATQYSKLPKSRRIFIIACGKLNGPSTGR